MKSVNGWRGWWGVEIANEFISVYKTNSNNKKATTTTIQNEDGMPSRKSTLGKSYNSSCSISRLA